MVSPSSGVCGFGGLEPGFSKENWSSPALGIGIGLDILPRTDWPIFWPSVALADLHNPAFIGTETRGYLALRIEPKTRSSSVTKDGEGWERVKREEPWRRGDL